MRKLYSNPLKYWVDGSTEKEVKLTVVEGGVPFCVRLSDDNWIPINFMVFARSHHEAETVFRQAMNAFISGIRKNKYDSMDRANRFEELLHRGELQVQKIDLDQVFQIGWADNDTL